MSLASTNFSRRVQAFCLLPFVAVLASCSSNAILFHESTKLGFSAVYNLADSQPVNSHFGFKRRIVAVVPSQERIASADGRERNATNRGEALSLVSKFYVRVGTFSEGVVIRNNFATGEAARVLTQNGNAAAKVGKLIHNETLLVQPTVTVPRTKAARRQRWQSE